jgi:hypothetical protein
VLRKLVLTGALAAAIAGLAGAGQASTVNVRAGQLSCAGAASWKRAGAFVGRVATLKGPVKSTKYAAYSSGSPTFLDIGRPYPREGLAIVIWSDNRSAFGRPEVKYRGRTICVRGAVHRYQGVPEIVARSKSQIRIIR